MPPATGARDELRGTLSDDPTAWYHGCIAPSLVLVLLVIVVVIAGRRLKRRLHGRLLGRDGGLALRVRLGHLLVDLGVCVQLVRRGVLRVLADLR